MTNIQLPVRWHDITLATAAENLALDEVLLQQVEATPHHAILRTWEPVDHFVVLGRSNRGEVELNLDQCRAEGIPIYRRCSGGGAVVVGPGCLAYALIQPLDPELLSLGVASVTKTVMETIASQLRSLASGIVVCGTSDLAIDDRKFSGNSQRWLKHAFLHHGTILYDYDLSRIGRLLKQPSRQPDYRSHRSHEDFVTNLRVEKSELVQTIVNAWNGQPAESDATTLSLSRELAREKYGRPDWNQDR